MAVAESLADLDVPDVWHDDFCLYPWADEDADTWLSAGDVRRARAVVERLRARQEGGC